MKAACRGLLPISLAVLVLSGCSGSTVTTKASSQVGKYRLHNIALIPFQSKSIDSIPAHEIAQRLGADAALSGKVLVYQERVGGRFGADPPAVVGFEAKLVAPDGNLLWEGNYYEKQRPMTEDVMGFIRRYGMFVTADELAAYGASKLAEDLPVGSSTK